MSVFSYCGSVVMIMQVACLGNVPEIKYPYYCRILRSIVVSAPTKHVDYLGKVRQLATSINEVQTQKT